GGQPRPPRPTAPQPRPRRPETGARVARPRLGRSDPRMETGPTLPRAAPPTRGIILPLFGAADHDPNEQPAATARDPPRGPCLPRRGEAAAGGLSRTDRALPGAARRRPGLVACPRIAQQHRQPRPAPVRQPPPVVGVG